MRIKGHLLPVLLENVSPKVSVSQSASLILVTQLIVRKGGFFRHRSLLGTRIF